MLLTRKVDSEQKANCIGTFREMDNGTIREIGVQLSNVTVLMSRVNNRRLTMATTMSWTPALLLSSM